MAGEFGVGRVLRESPLVLALLLAACGGAGPTDPLAPPSAVPSPAITATPAEAEPTGETTSAVREEEEAMEFTLSSSAFQQGEEIPQQYTCDGPDQSPPLAWSEPPADALALALVMDDPDAPAGTWDHWILYNLPAGAGQLPTGVTPGEAGPEGSAQGENSWGRLGYGGPCPPGGTHRYFFRLYALDAQLDLSPGLNKGELLQAVEGHVLGQAELMGTYTR